MLRAREIFGILNMEEFGTTEEGFNDAINELSNGGVVYIPRNVQVTLTNSMKIKANRARVYVVGAGHSSEIKIGDGTDDTALVVDGASKLRIMNLYINGNRANNNSGGGIHIRNAEDFEISNCWIGDSSTTGTTDAAIRVENSSHFSIKRCWIRNPAKDGIVIDEACTDFNISQVLVDMQGSNANSGQSGIVIQNNCQAGVVDACTLRNLAYGGVLIADSRQMAVHHCSINNFGNRTAVITNHGGITVRGTTPSRRCTGITIQGNHSVGGQYGVQIGAHVVGCNVIGNYVLTNTVRGLDFTGSATSQVNFRGNMCMNVSNNGRITFASNSSVTTLAVGVSNLPIGAIHATWDVFPPERVKNSVLGARYKGVTIFFYNSSKLSGEQTCWYSVET